MQKLEVVYLHSQANMSPFLQASHLFRSWSVFSHTAGSLKSWWRGGVGSTAHSWTGNCASQKGGPVVWCSSVCCFFCQNTFQIYPIKIGWCWTWGFKKKKKIPGSFIPRFSLCLGYVCEWNISSLGWAPSEYFLPIFSAIITHWFHIIMLILILRVGGRGSLCSVVSLKLLHCCLKELWLCCISFQASSGIIFPPVLPSQCDSCLSALWALN